MTDLLLEDKSVGPDQLIEYFAKFQAQIEEFQKSVTEEFWRTNSNIAEIDYPEQEKGTNLPSDASSSVEEPQVFKCNSCQMVCEDLFDLAIHINATHLEQKMYRCKPCKFTHISALEDHLKSCSDKESRRQEHYECNVFNCGVAFCCPKSLSSHLKFHFVDAGVEFFNSSYWSQESDNAE